MAKPSDIRIVQAEVQFEPVPFRAPLKFGGRVMQGGSLINVTVEVENRKGHHAPGFGSMPVGNVWAWPSPAVTPEQSDTAMKKFAERVVELANEDNDFAHPIEVMHLISGEYAHIGQTISKKMGLADEMPELAQLVAASALDAALHDAFGRANNQNSYNLLSSSFMSSDLSDYLDDEFEGEYLDKYTLREPKPRMPLYHLVGALDPLTAADVQKKIGDGLPETLADWIAAEGLTHLKIKLAGDDLEWDVARVLAIDKVAAEVQAKKKVTQWHYSCDFNEKCADVDYVVTFLKRIGKEAPAAYDRIQYVEQPTHRDLKAHMENKMHEAAKLKPIVIDESLVDYEALQISRDLGYTGVALKTCKGHSEALILGAAAQKFGMFLCVQDLTCPGYSFLHSASLAARVPGVAAIEGNGRQYCPAGNKRFARMFPGMFQIKDGTVETGVLDGIGLGF